MGGRMTAETVFLAKWLGLYLVVVSVALLANPRRALAAFAEIMQSGPALLMAGMIAAAVGLGLILGHQVWRGGALALAVTLAGFAALIKGLWLMFVPPPLTAEIYRAFGLERHFRLWMAGVLVAGLALTAAAFGA